jgi:hypothetical protein
MAVPYESTPDPIVIGAIVPFMATLAAQKTGGMVRALAQREAALTLYAKHPKRCAHCGGPIPLPPSGVPREARKKKFCNSTCSALATSHSPRRRRGPPRTACACGSFDSVRHGRCRACRRQPKTDVLFTMTKGELFSRSATWQSARSAIQRHARKIYLDSGAPTVCIVCGYARHIEVAHRKAVSAFKANVTIDEINRIENLMALCRNHHWEQEHDGLVVAEIGVAPDVG